MRSSKLILLFASWLLVSCSQQMLTPGASPSSRLGGGTDLGNGSDWIPETSRAHWFPKQGKTPVEYCIEVSPTFGKSAAELATLVDLTFGQWDSYIDEKKLPSRFLSITALYVGECAENTPLRFYFGVEGEGVSEVLPGYRKPFGIAKFNPQSKKGFVWIAESSRYEASLPDWTQDRFLLTELLHEVGHIYGNEHVPGTVMREHLAYELPSLPEKYLGQIDQNEELVPGNEGTWNCDPTPIDPGAAIVFSDRFPNGALLKLHRAPAFRSVPLPFGPFSIWLPNFPSSLSITLEGGGFSETFTNVGDEAVVSHPNPHRAFLVSENDLQWSAPATNQSYIVTVTSDSRDTTLQLMLSRSEGNVEIFYQPDEISLLICPLKR